MKRYIFIGSVENSAHALRALIEMKINIVCILCPHPSVSHSNSDYYDLRDIAKETNVPFRYFNKIQEEIVFIHDQKPDIMFVLGLSQIIKRDILSIPTIGCIGIHPSLLPLNRGRHPIIWALVNGCKRTGVSLFWLDEGADTGDIWAQESFLITPEDDARSVYSKVTAITVNLLKKNVIELEQGRLNRIPQTDSDANTLRKRNKYDGRVDWRMSTVGIHNLVRALTRPYIGAHCLYLGKECKIWKAQPAGILDNPDRVVEPGKILMVEQSAIKVKTGDGAITLVDHELTPLPTKGSYL